MKSRFYLALFAVIATIGSLTAKEGMWLPVFLEKYNLADMQKMGFRLNAKDVYDVNHASLKDAVVIFGSGCTGELISGDGLLITNHHCGFGQVQKHSSVEHDYIANGFWAMSKQEELPNQGLTVSFLEYMEDVTDKMIEGINNLSPSEIIKKMEANRQKITREASVNGKFLAQVKPLFYGNQYFLFVYKIYKDVRLVGAPPSAIGKFGGDTDNWVWPRHTGDFSLFRIYAGKNNEPAAYSPDNVPFKPKKFFPVSVKGVKEGDFTMVFGYPGTTMEYLPHQAVALIMNQRDPDRIKIRDKKLEIINAAMETNNKVRIQYSAKAYGISNSWKKWQGEILGLKKNDAINKKIAFENEFKEWAIKAGNWDNLYKKVFEKFETLHKPYSEYVGASDYYSEIVLRGIELFGPAASVLKLAEQVEKQADSLAIKRELVAKSFEPFFKDYYQPIDEKLFVTLLQMMKTGVAEKFLPKGFSKTMEEKNDDELIRNIYRKSVLTDRQKITDLVLKGTKKQILGLRKDPVVKMYADFQKLYSTQIKPVTDSLSAEIDAGMNIYMAGIMEFAKGRPLYPDANSTLRVTYGKVEGYEPSDGITYKHFTTLKGIMEKDNPAIYDYDVPKKLKDLYHQGNSADMETLPVCFTASNHTTGGNSGSPVVNANGELVGINFDRCWEGTMSDIMYDPDICRNISLDTRYIVFVIDRFANAGYLLNEMDIRK